MENAESALKHRAVSDWRPGRSMPYRLAVPPAGSLRHDTMPFPRDVCGSIELWNIRPGRAKNVYNHIQKFCQIKI